MCWADSKCCKCCQAERTEKRRLYHCGEGREERNTMRDVARSREMKEKSSKNKFRSGSEVTRVVSKVQPGMEKQWLMEAEVDL